MSGILIKNVKYIKDTKLYLSNINLLVNYDENLVIVAKDSDDIKSCQYLTRLIASNLKPTTGTLDYAKTNDNRIVIGFNNFENIIKKNIKVSDFIKTLIKTQKLSQQNLSEIEELKEILKIHDYYNKTTGSLNHQQLFTLNLLSLLIVKPHMIFIDHLNLPGSSKIHAAILSYLKEYCKSYKIRMVISSNEKFVQDIIADRKLVVSKSKIITDNLIKRDSQLKSIEVDNKTKAFDLEEDIQAVLNNKAPTKKVGIETSDLPDKKIMDQLTKALDDTFEPIKEEYPSKTSYTNDLLTTKYEDELNTNEFQYTNSPLNEKFTGSLEFEKEEIKQKTRRFNDDSKDVLEDIKISQPNKIHSSTKPFNSSSNIDNNLLTNDFLADLKETYTIRRELGQQIKSPDFTRLNPDLQLKVFDNYERADSLIKETDPDGLYDPYKQETVEINRKDYLHEPRNNTVTKMLIEETIHTSNIDDEIEYTSTSRYETEEIKDNTLNNVIDNVATSAYFDNEDDFVTYKYKTSQTKDSKPTGDFLYHDNEKKNKPKKSSWRDRFVKKDVDKALSEEIYGKQRTTKTTNSFSDELDDFTKDLKNAEPTSKTTSILNNNTSKYYNTSDSQELFEDDSKTSSFRNETKINRPTRNFTKTSPINKETSEFRKPPKTIAIKQRSKKNLIERLYDEALEDNEIIEGFKDQKFK